MDINPALPRRSPRTLAAGRCRRRIAGVRRPRRVHRDRNAVPRTPTAEADTVAPFPESGDLDAGTYLVTGYPVPFEVTVPDGWATSTARACGKDDPDHPD